MTAAARHPAATAGHLLVPAVATGTPGEAAGQAFLGLAGRRFDSLENLHVVDAEGRLLGIVPLTELARAPAEARLGVLMRPAEALHEHDRVTALRRHETVAPPVVDGAGRLLGCIPPQAMLALGRRAHGRDVARMAGILHRSETGQEHGARHALEGAPWRLAVARLPWLLVGLAGSALMAALVAGFEARLSANIAVAFFVPALVFLADAVGTQTEVVVIRRLSLGPLSVARVALGEMAAGTLVGLVLAAIALPLVWLALGDLRLASAVALALVAACCAATACGLLFPLAMARMGVDPAFGSGPVATVFQDGATLLLYFAAVLLVLPG